ncbi:MAG: hypothetical protein IJW05_08765 [Lentisphaeria bacterium]|nr:hypothetical protein [Lentisphaeria bacterium]
MKRISILTILLLLTAFHLAAAELMDMIGKDFKIFSESRPRFIKPSNARFFRWTSDEKVAARYPAYQNISEILTLFGQPVSEVIVHFKGNLVSSIYISVYNRGDNRPINGEQFHQMMKKLYDQLKTLYPNEKPVSRKAKISEGVFVNAIIWRGKKFSCTMKWSLSGKNKRTERPEYLQVEFEPFDPARDPAKRPLARADRTGIVARKNLPENVKRDRAGNVYIDNIPMVDQGDKGYCVAAVLERVLRYYNVPVNQHTIAQLCGTTASGGTSTEAMVRTLEDVSIKFGVKIRDQYQLFDNRNAIKKLEQIVSEYNRVARREKKEEVKMVIRGRMVFLDETIFSMDPEIYAKVRNEDSDYRDFYRTITKNVLDGVPVIWCVMLGIMPEEKLSPQSRGGHMRLIIGFNNKNQEILYTDTWGIGHELKSMPIQHAWPITTRLLYLIPRERKRY